MASLCPDQTIDSCRQSDPRQPCDLKVKRNVGQSKAWVEVIHSTASHRRRFKNYKEESERREKESESFSPSRTGERIDAKCDEI